jgi:hypothetical protein
LPARHAADRFGIGIATAIVWAPHPPFAHHCAAPHQGRLNQDFIAAATPTFSTTWAQSITHHCR